MPRTPERPSIASGRANWRAFERDLREVSEGVFEKEDPVIEAKERFRIGSLTSLGWPGKEKNRVDPI